MLPSLKARNKGKRMVPLWLCSYYIGIYCCWVSLMLSFLAVVYCSWVGAVNFIILEVSAHLDVQPLSSKA